MFCYLDNEEEPKIVEKVISIADLWVLLELFVQVEGLRFC